MDTSSSGGSSSAKSAWSSRRVPVRVIKASESQCTPLPPIRSEGDPNQFAVFCLFGVQQTAQVLAVVPCGRSAFLSSVIGITCPVAPGKGDGGLVGCRACCFRVPLSAKSPMPCDQPCDHTAPCMLRPGASWAAEDVSCLQHICTELPSHSKSGPGGWGPFFGEHALLQLLQDPKGPNRRVALRL